jgi:hypothetical protein
VGLAKIFGFYYTTGLGGYGFFYCIFGGEAVLKLFVNKDPL